MSKQTVSIRVYTPGRIRTRRAFSTVDVPASFRAAGLAVTARLDGQFQPVKGKWEVTHVASGAKLPGGPWKTVAAAREYLDAVLPLADWTQSSKAFDHAPRTFVNAIHAAARIAHEHAAWRRSRTRTAAHACGHCGTNLAIDPFHPCQGDPRSQEN
jgi:hypothetical protein